MIFMDFTTSSVVVEMDYEERRIATLRVLEGPGSVNLPTQVIRLTDDDRTLMTHTVASRSGETRSMEYDLEEAGTYFVQTRTRNDPRGNVHVRAITFRLRRPTDGIVSITILSGSSPSDWIIQDEALRMGGQTERTFEIRVFPELSDCSVAHQIEPEAQPKAERSTAWARILQDDEPDSV